MCTSRSSAHHREQPHQLHRYAGRVKQLHHRRADHTPAPRPADPIMLMAHNMAAAMAAGEFKDIPGFGPLMAGAQCIFLDRNDPHSRSKAKAEIERRARQPGWPHLLIFPEATTTNQSCLLRFKRGAFDLGLPVQPVVVRQPWQHHDPCWVDEGPGTGGIWARMLGQFYMSMSVQYLPVCVPTPEEVADPDLFAERVRRVMAEALRVPLSALSQDDNAVTTHAARRGYPVDHVTVGLMQFRSLGVKPKAFRPLVDLFQTLDTARVGHLEPKQLAALLRYPLSGAGLSHLAALHRHVLADCDGAFTFHGFILLWLALAARLPGGWHTLANMAVTLAGAQAGPGPSLDRLAECVASFAQDPSQARQRLLDSWAPALPAAAVPVEELAAWMEANSASVIQALQAALVPEHPAVDSNALWSGFLPAVAAGRASAE